MSLLQCFPGKMASGPYNYSYIFKYIIIGDMGVGKSCLLHQFTEKKCKRYSAKCCPSSECCSYGRLSSYHRGGVRDEDHRGLRAEDQAADLGHGRAGEVRPCVSVTRASLVSGSGSQLVTLESIMKKVLKCATIFISQF